MNNRAGIFDSIAAHFEQFSRLHGAERRAHPLYSSVAEFNPLATAQALHECAARIRAKHDELGRYA